MELYKYNNKAEQYYVTSRSPGATQIDFCLSGAAVNGIKRLIVVIHWLKQYFYSLFRRFLTQFLQPFVFIKSLSTSIANKKVQVKLSLCLTKHHAMKAYWGNGSIAPHIP
jgi:isochorismate hydrolase